MSSHREATAARRSMARASPFGIVALIALALASVWGSACGGTPSLSQTLALSQTAVLADVQSVASATVDKAMDKQSLHERVMAEQGRGSGSAADEGPTTTTIAANSSPPIASPTATPPVEQEGATAIVLSSGQTPIKGVWSGTAEQLASFLLNASPSPSFTVSTSVLAEYYVHYGAEAGLRADLLWAQMIHETGYGIYGGAALPEQNNYAGIGTTGGGEPGLSFPSAEAGVMAQVAHMVAYVYTSSPVPWANASTDPRFDLVNPRGAAAVLADLNGRWAVPGTTYGEAIEAIARAINSA